MSACEPCNAQRADGYVPPLGSKCHRWCSRLRWTKITGARCALLAARTCQGQITAKSVAPKAISQSSAQKTKLLLQVKTGEDGLSQPSCTWLPTTNVYKMLAAPHRTAVNGACTSGNGRGFDVSCFAGLMFHVSRVWRFMFRGKEKQRAVGAGPGPIFTRFLSTTPMDPRGRGIGRIFSAVKKKRRQQAGATGRAWQDWRWVLDPAEHSHSWNASPALRSPPRGRAESERLERQRMKEMRRCRMTWCSAVVPDRGACPPRRAKAALKSTPQRRSSTPPRKKHAMHRRATRGGASACWRDFTASFSLSPLRSGRRLPSLVLVGQGSLQSVVLRHVASSKKGGK